VSHDGDLGSLVRVARVGDRGHPLELREHTFSFGRGARDDADVALIGIPRRPRVAMALAARVGHEIEIDRDRSEQRAHARLDHRLELGVEPIQEGAPRRVRCALLVDVAVRRTDLLDHDAARDLRLLLGRHRRVLQPHDQLDVARAVRPTR
jgi:hypothetical protein